MGQGAHDPTPFGTVFDLTENVRKVMIYGLGITGTVLVRTARVADSVSMGKDTRLATT